MSAKATGLVWDLECPKVVNGFEFKDNHKYVLLAYADHADHFGKNIYPGIPTISKKTGYKDRNVQYITHALEDMGLLVEDGVGPRGTNKWRIPFDDGGAKIAPVQNLRGAKNIKSLGAIPSGAIPSGAKFAPELKEPEPLIYIINEKEFDLNIVWGRVVDCLKEDMLGGSFDKRVKDSIPVSFDDHTLSVCVRDDDTRDWLVNRLTSTVRRLLVGIMNMDVEVCFVVAESVI